MNNIEEFAKIIKKSQNIVFFGGAGVSTESGLKDYRSADGIYNTALCYGMPPEEILSHDCFYENTELFYRFYRDYFTVKAEPGNAHKVVAQLEKTGKNVSVVTQNIDGLHQKAGSTKVFELHGNAQKFYCVNCGKKYGAECLETNKNVPRCECGGVIKPVVTLYGEMLDEKTVSKAIEAIKNADLLIIGGTSLGVYPAAGFIRYFGGEKIVIINKEKTHFDSNADLVFHESIGEVLSNAVKIIDSKDLL